MSTPVLRVARINFAFILFALAANASPDDKEPESETLAKTYDAACPEDCPLRLPIRIVGSNAVTEITVGGKAVQAIVDTGGGAIALTEDVIRGSGGVRSARDLEWSDAGGKKYRVPKFKVPEVVIGGRMFKKVSVIQATVREGPAVPNTIGGRFLSQFISVFDYAGLSIALWSISAKDATNSVCGGNSIPMQKTEQRDLAVSQFTTSSGRLNLLWDTGATYSMLTNTFIADRGLAMTSRGQTPFYGPVELTAGGQTFAPLEFVVLPLQLPRDLDGTLGANFFMNHVVCLDYHRREVRVR